MGDQETKKSTSDVLNAQQATDVFNGTGWGFLNVTNPNQKAPVQEPKPVNSVVTAPPQNA